MSPLVPISIGEGSGTELSVEDLIAIILSQLSEDPSASGPQGERGDQGPAGRAPYVGAGAPSESLGGVDDVYFNSANGDVYAKTGGTWGAPVGNIRGVQGLTGAQGLKGDQGDPGDAGDPATTTLRGVVKMTYDNVDSLVVEALHNVQFGVVSVVTGAPEITFASQWGIDDDGPYFDVDGASAGEAAVVTINDDGILAVVKPGG